jgi:cytoskeletal protein RodZ
MSRLFNRNKKTTIAELEEYYANQERKKNSTGKAWLMAFLSLFITLVVIALLFLAGRWVYRTITSNDSTTTTTETSETENADLPTFDSDNGVVGQGSTSEDNSSTETQGTVSDEAASTSVPNTDQTTDVATGGTTNDNVDEVPNTGAGYILFAAPVITAVSGYIFARRRFIKNS